MRNTSRYAQRREAMSTAMSTISTPRVLCSLFLGQLDRSLMVGEIEDQLVFLLHPEMHFRKVNSETHAKRSIVAGRSAYTWRNAVCPICAAHMPHAHDAFRIRACTICSASNPPSRSNSSPPLSGSWQYISLAAERRCCPVVPSRPCRMRGCQQQQRFNRRPRQRKRSRAVSSTRPRQTSTCLIRKQPLLNSARKTSLSRLSKCIALNVGLLFFPFLSDGRSKPDGPSSLARYDLFGQCSHFEPAL